MSEKNAYEKVQALMDKDPELGIGEACKKAGVVYSLFDYHRKKANGGKRLKEIKATRTVVKGRNSRAAVPVMQTYVIPENEQQAYTRPAGNGKVIAVVGSAADVTATLRDLLRN